MKKIFTYFFLIFSFAIAAQTKVKVHVTYTSNYCGGARPTPEMEEIAKTPKNFHDVHIILNGKIHCKTKTDSLGYFTLPLKPGKYKIYLTKFKNEAHYTGYDPSCPQMLKASYSDLIIEKGNTEYEINLHFGCNPCGPPKP
jgi:hypothetical protein